MAFRAICVALLLASLPSAGCGTIANLANSHPEQGGTTPFGGVRKDVSCMKKSEDSRQPALMLFCAADLPLSAIGDVVTWPYTKTYTYINQPTPTTPVTLAPTYPAMQAPPYPAIPAEMEIQPQPPPLETLPQPKEAR